jgi:hypothetical protein
MNMERLVFRVGITLTLAILVAISACREGVLSAPTRSAPSEEVAAYRNGAPGQNPSRPAAAAQAPHPVVCAVRRPLANGGVFGPGGGTLVIGNSRLIIPGGALRDTVTITATTGGDSTSTVNFQPEGLQFRKPVGLILDSTGCAIDDGANPSVVYLGTDGTVLETIPAIYDPHWKAVAAPIEHFSGYAIAF